MKGKGCFLTGCGLYVLLTLAIFVYGYFFHEDDEKEVVKTEQVKTEPRTTENKAKFKPSVVAVDTIKSEFFGELESQEIVLPRNYAVWGESKLTLRAGEKVKTLFYVAEDDELYPVVENNRGERYTLFIEKNGNFDEILAKPLKVLNPDFHYYVGGTLRQTDDFVYGSHIADVVKKWGEYTYMRKQKDGSYKYGFSHITYAQGISRSHIFYCNTDANGYVISSQSGRESSNLFGFLFFYADILSLNIFSSYEPVMYDNRDEYLDTVGKSKETVAFIYIAYSLIASLLAFLLLCAVARIKKLSNKVVVIIFYTVFIVLQYALLVALMEYYHGWWVLLLLFLPGLQLMFVARACEDEANIKCRCPKCHEMNAVSYNSRHTGNDKYIKANITFGYPKYSGGLPTYKVEFKRGEEQVIVASCKYCSYVQSTYADDVRVVTTCPDCGRPLIECAKGENGEIGIVDFDNLRNYVRGQYSVLEFDFIYKAQCENCGWDYKYSGHFDVEKVVSSQTSRRNSSDAGTGKKSGSLGSCRHLRRHSDGSLRGSYYCNINSNNVSVSGVDDSCKCMRSGSNCSDYETM